MVDERNCPGCGMISTDWWQCQCEQEVSLRDEAAYELALAKALDDYEERLAPMADYR